ncbi:hypothetical protein FSP39_000965 [Pinctada imbricata]|uniref:CARD domain-containing protein n=1 Tax=Pinctada imbricata TaxID=66713 RepID=A0AA88XKJ2_PINIB|nr:hypothetical protein FSP39_000965 [Pinctada imbricata]
MDSLTSLLSKSTVTPQLLQTLVDARIITTADKNTVQRLIDNPLKMKQLLRILTNRKETIHTFITAFKIEPRNEWVLNKLEKKVKLCKRRLQQQDKTASSYFSQLDDVAEVMYVRGFKAIYGKSEKVVAGTSHKNLVDDLGRLATEVEDCREILDGQEDKSFKDIIKECRLKNEQQIKDTQMACANVVKTKNNIIEQKNKEIRDLKDQMAKLRIENESYRKNMDSVIRGKVQEGVQERLKNISVRKFDSREDTMTTMASDVTDDVMTDDDRENEHLETDAQASLPPANFHEK